MGTLFAGFATSRPDEPALIDDHGTTTWAEYDRRVNQLIHHLRRLGIAPGERIALVSGNRRETYEVVGAAAQSGISVVPVNWHFAPDEVEYVVDNSSARLVITDPEFDHLAAGTPVPRLQFDSSYEDALASEPDTNPDGQLMGGVMFYTSGTTGRPKGVRNTTAQTDLPAEIYQLMAAGFGASLGFPQAGRTLLCGPHYHSAQWAFSFFPMVTGSSTVIQRRFVPEETLDLIDRHEITNVHLVPTQFVRLLRVDDERRRAFSGESLLFVLHGAAPCSPDVKRQMIDWWGPRITEYYGATEGGVVSVISSEEWLARPGSVGKPTATMTLQIVPEDGSDPGPNIEGVIHMRSAMGTDFEYLGEPQKTAEAHSLAGFFTMGDIGYLDADGYLYLSDRKIDMIISGGVNIYPAEIEGVLAAHTALVDVAVFGVPNEEFGEEVKAAVQLAPGVGWSPELERDLAAFARERLAGYKVPRSFDVVAEMPRSEAGKLLKRQLRATYWEGTGRKI